MHKQRTIRRLAMQALYQLDVRGEGDREAIHDAVRDDARGPDLAEAALTLAEDAWRHHADADAMATELAPDWPTHRQPPVDRAVLRLAYGEMVTGRTPVKVAINEAVELAKQFGAEQSPAFINGVLDKVARRIRKTQEQESGKAENEEGSGAAAAPDTWLADALKDRDAGAE